MINGISMTEDTRPYDIKRLLFMHSRPVLKYDGEQQIRDLTNAIMKIADGSDSPWTKWGELRESIARRVAEVWVPMDDLREALNGLRGPKLTVTDVEQRIRAIREEPYSGGGPREEAKDRCLAAYAAERANGTEFIAILGFIEEWMYGEEEGLRLRDEERNRARIQQNKRNAEARLRSGADCPWTAADGVAEQHCRKNYRLFRLKVLSAAHPLEPKFEVLRVKSLEDRRGTRIGQYRTRTDASKAVVDVAFKDEWD
jgi:hypothetical protein